MKKFLSVFMSCALLVTSAGGFADFSAFVSTASASVSVNSNNKEKGCLDKHPGLKKFLKVAGITAGCVFGAKLLIDCTKEVAFIGYCNFLSNHPEKMGENLKKIEGQKMDRQEGIGWCWNACLTRALHNQGLKDVTQKKVYRAMGGSRWWVSPWKTNRRQGSIDARKDYVDEVCPGVPAIFWLLTNPVYLDQVEKGVSKLSGGKLEYQTVYLPWEKMKLPGSDKLYSSRVTTAVLRNLLNKVRENNKEAILITACPFTSGGHAVTIEEVDDKQIIFGEPTSGTMLAIPCDKFFYAKNSSLRDKLPLNKIAKDGMAINMVVKKGQAISLEWWEKMIDEVVEKIEADGKAASRTGSCVAA